jgi:hypothetical protein
MKTFFETPDEIRQQIWKELGRASQDRHHAWRTPVFATASADGSVNARTVVMRRVDAVAGVLEIYTDSRSEKVADLAHQPRAQLVFWSERLHWQLRVTVTALGATDGLYVQKLWQSVKQSPAARDYLGVEAPGALLDEDRATAAILSDKTHFAVVSGTVIEMDWLELARDNHRRAKLTADTWAWLKP